METMAEAIDAAGFTAVNVDYPSREYPIEELAPMAVGKGLLLCEAAGATEKVHFVTHSLGGILVRKYLKNNEIKNLGRVVMLGPPNQGSKAVDELGDLPGFDWLNGPAGRQLGKGPRAFHYSWAQQILNSVSSPATKALIPSHLRSWMTPTTAKCQSRIPNWKVWMISPSSSIHMR